MTIEICIINPYASAISNEKIKLCAQKVIDKNSSIFINSENSQVDYFELHSETINISKLIKAVEKNTYKWNVSSTYIKHPPFFNNENNQTEHNIKDARILVLLGDSVTTDHILSLIHI